MNTKPKTIGTALVTTPRGVIKIEIYRPAVNWVRLAIFSGSLGALLATLALLVF